MINNRFNDENAVLHRIRAKLFRSYLPKVEEPYIARTENEAMLNIRQICLAMQERGGFKGNFNELVDYVGLFLNEAAYQLCDGFSVNMDFFSVHPNIGGTFSSNKDVYDSKKNPISFRFRSRLPLRKLVRHITVDVSSFADCNAYIYEFTDLDEDSADSVFSPGNMFSIMGSKIKIAGDNPDCGVYFVPVDDPSKAVKVARIGENNPSRIIGIAPDTQYLQNKIEIRTQFSGTNGRLLKAPRVITGDFMLEVI